MIVAGSARQRRVLEADERFVCDGCVTMVTLKRKQLSHDQQSAQTQRNPEDRPRLVVVDPAVGSPLMLVKGDVLEELVTVLTAKAGWVPTLAHGADNAASDDATTVVTEQGPQTLVRNGC